jgi:hypothetical protein
MTAKWSAFRFFNFVKEGKEKMRKTIALNGYWDFFELI